MITILDEVYKEKKIRAEELLKTKVEFDLDNIKEPIDKANAMMQYIINRAAIFNAEKFDKILFPITNDNKGMFLYHGYTIIAMMRGISVFAYSKEPWYRRIKFWNKKNRLIKRVGKRKWNKLLQDNKSLIFNTMCADSREQITPAILNYPMIFAGITEEQIDFIIKELSNVQQKT